MKEILLIGISLTLIVRAMISDSYKFTFASPLPEDYRISILLDPCRLLTYNCCVNAFGVGEYPSLRDRGLEAERVLKVSVLGSDTEVAINYDLVYEDGTIVSTGAQRAADDETVIDILCERKGYDTFGNPSNKCYGKNYAFARSMYRPFCSDNNYSLNSLTPCYDASSGAVMTSPCVQVGYSQNTFIATCSSPSADCGTYLEVHLPFGSPYSSEMDIIAEVLIDQYNVSGVYTTSIPTTWMNNNSQVLCSYSESFLRVGVPVYILPSSPACCCPPPYDSLTDIRNGSFFCPNGPLGKGPFATFDSTIEDSLAVDLLNQVYPYCISDRNSSDMLMCSVQDQSSQRYYTRPCLPANYSTGENFTGWTTPDLGSHGRTYFPPKGEDGICPFFNSCVRTADATCNFPDNLLSFSGQVGTITAMDDISSVRTVSVTFNNGRSYYTFKQSDVKLNVVQKSMYEIWWVLRTAGNRIVQKRKGFNVTAPECTFDVMNNRYFPYSILSTGGLPIASA